MPGCDMTRRLHRLRCRLLLCGATLALAAQGLLAGYARAEETPIPAFARKYDVSCSLCHAPFPRLNGFGEDFAANGFVLARNAPPQDTVDVADPLLLLQDRLPLAIRVDSYIQALSRKEGNAAGTDLKTPWMIKILSGGQISDAVSYYLYFFLSERGEVAGLEDAYLQFSDLLNSGIDVVAGQFQVSDPMFKRELRLEFEDYALYRARVGEVRADMTYDRGLMLSASPWEGGDVVGQIVNGRGLGEASETREYDGDTPKNLALRVSQDAGRLRLGGFVYRGWERSEGLTDDILVWGPDATVAFTPGLELNLQFIRRTDSNPYFLADCPTGSVRCFSRRSDPFEITTDGVLAELLFFPGGESGRWVVTGLFNRVDADREAVSLRIGEEGPVDLYQVGAAGVSYQWARNLRLLGETAWDFELDRARFTVGAVAAF